MLFFFLSLKIIQLPRHVRLLTINLYFITVRLYFITKVLYYNTDDVSSISVSRDLKNFIKKNYKNLHSKLNIKPMRFTMLCAYYKILIILTRIIIITIKVVVYCLSIPMSCIYGIYYIYYTCLILFQILKLSTLTLVLFFLNMKGASKHVTYVY